MKVVALIVMSLVMWPWAFATPPYDDPQYEPCHSKLTSEHLSETVRSKREISLKNISNASKRAAIIIRKRLHIVNKREEDNLPQLNDQVSKDPNTFNLPTNNTSNENTAGRVKIQEQKPSNVTFDESPNLKNTSGGSEDYKNKREIISSIKVKIYANTTRKTNIHSAKIKRQSSINETVAQLAQNVTSDSPNNGDIKGQNVEDNNHQTQSLNDTHDIQNNSNKSQIPDIVIDGQKPQRAFKRQPCSAKRFTNAKNTTRIQRQTDDYQHDTPVAQNITRVKKQITDLLQNGTQAAENRQTSDHQDHSQNGPNSTRNERQIFENIVNDTQETQNTTKVRRLINYQQYLQSNFKGQLFDPRNNTELQNKNITKRQSPDHQNHTQETNNTTHQHENGIHEAQDTTKVKRETSHYLHNETQNSTRVKRFLPDDHQNKSDTQETQNVTRSTRQVFANFQNDTQNTTKVTRQTSFQHQLHKDLKRQAFDTQNYTEVLNETITKRESPNFVPYVSSTQETHDNSRLIRQSSHNHQNESQEAQNITTVKRETSYHPINETKNAQNITKVKRQTSYNSQNDTEPQNITTVKRRASQDYQNETQNAQNITRVLRQTYADQNITQESQNSTRTKRQTDIEVPKNTTKITRQTHQNHTHNTTRITRQISDYYENNTQNSERMFTHNENINNKVAQNTTAKRQADILKNDTQVIQNVTVVKRDTAEYKNNTDIAHNQSNINLQTLNSEDTNDRNAENKTINKRQSTEILNNTVGATNTTLVKRQSSGDQNLTQPENNATKSHFVSYYIDSSKEQTGTIVRRQISDPQVTSSNSTNATTETRSAKNLARKTRQNSDALQNSTIIKTEENSHHYGKRDNVKEQETANSPRSIEIRPGVFPPVNQTETAKRGRRTVLNASGQDLRETVENTIRKIRSANCSKDSEHHGNTQQSQYIRRTRAFPANDTIALNSSDTLNSTLVNQKQRRDLNQTQPASNVSASLNETGINNQEVRNVRSTDNSTMLQNGSLSQESKNVSSNQRTARFTDQQDSHIMKIPGRASQNGTNSTKNSSRERRWTRDENERDVTSSEESDMLSQPYLENSQNETIMFIRRPLVISVSGQKNITDKDPLQFYEPATADRKSYIGQDTPQVSIDEANNNYYRYRFIPDIRTNNDKNDIVENDENAGNDIRKIKEYSGRVTDDGPETDEENENRINPNTEKAKLVRCSCATYSSEHANQIKNPSFTENFVEVPLDMNGKDTELLCTKNCSEAASINMNIKQQIYCTYVEADPNKMKKLFPSDHTPLPKVSDIIFCQVFIGDGNEPTLQFILSWLNVLLLDVVVCLTGLGIVCIYLICFVTWRKRNNGPIYTPTFSSAK